MVFEKEKGHSLGYNEVNSFSSTAALSMSSEFMDIDFLNGALSLILLEGIWLVSICTTIRVILYYFK
jgi:hypothetical protein